MGKQLTPKKRAKKNRCAIHPSVKSELAGKSKWSIDAQVDHLTKYFNYTRPYAMKLVKEYRGVGRRK